MTTPQAQVLVCAFEDDSPDMYALEHHRSVTHAPDCKWAAYNTRSNYVLIPVTDVPMDRNSQPRCAQIVESAGGTVIATVEICDRLEAVVDPGVPNYALAEYEAPENYAVAECPMCRAGEPITTF